MPRVFVVAVFGLAALSQLSAVVIRDDVRVLCQTEWRDDMLSKLPPQPGRTFDITIPLAEIPRAASAAQLLRFAEHRAGVRAATDFINSFRIYRGESGSPRFNLIEHHRLRGDSSPLAPRLRAGDVVVFHGIVDRW